MADAVAIPILATTIPEFCAQHRISRSHFYNLKRRDLGPRTLRLGGKQVITTEAAAEWRERMAQLPESPSLNNFARGGGRPRKNGGAR